MVPTKTTEQFVERAREIHGDSYAYAKTVYGKARGPKVTITCLKHGDFQQLPVNHLAGSGCRKCGNLKTSDHFIADAKAVHGELYDYSKVVYVRAFELVTIVCPVHGDFDQTPASHVYGRGCPDCAIHTRLDNFRRAKTYTLGGVDVKVQGYEPQALDYIIHEKKIDPDDIVVGKEIPLFDYVDPIKGHDRRYYPDIYLPGDNRIVEVKSLYTFCGTEDVYLVNRSKALAVKAAGYNFTLMLMLEPSNGESHRLKLPTDWCTYSYPQIMKFLY